MDPEHLAKEANRLLNDDVLISAFRQVRQDALEALATADVANETQILRLQARAAAIDEVLALLSGAILRSTDQNGAISLA